MQFPNLGDDLSPFFAEIDLCTDERMLWDWQCALENRGQFALAAYVLERLTELQKEYVGFSLGGGTYVRTVDVQGKTIRDAYVHLQKETRHVDD